MWEKRHFVLWIAVLSNIHRFRRIFEDDAPKQTTVEEDLYYLGTFAGSVLLTKRQENCGLCPFSTEAARSDECTDSFLNLLNS